MYRNQDRPHLMLRRAKTLSTPKVEMSLAGLSRPVLIVPAAALRRRPVSRQQAPGECTFRLFESFLHSWAKIQPNTTRSSSAWVTRLAAPIWEGHSSISATRFDCKSEINRFLSTFHLVPPPEISVGSC